MSTKTVIQRHLDKMKSTALLLLPVLLLCGCTTTPGNRILDVSEYGILPNTGHNSTAAVNHLIEGLEKGPITLVFPKGRYDFYPDTGYLRTYYETNTYDVNPKRLAILLEDKQDITLDARGSDFVYHGHIQPFTLDHCERITIKNVRIDWDHPLTAEAKVLEADSTHILIGIDTAQFPYTVHEKGLTFAADDWEAEWRLSSGSWLIEINEDHIIPPATGDLGTVNGALDKVVYSDSGPGLVLMQGRFSKTPTVGHHLVLRHSTRDHAGMFLFHSKNIRLEDIRVYHTSGLGILSQYCEDIRMNRVDMIPNPDKNRYLSGHDDGLHFMGCRGELKINDCDAWGLMDDPINIHGTYVPVIERVNDFTLRCRYAHDMSLGLIWAKKGDSVGFVEKSSMNTLGTGIVRRFLQPNEQEFLLEFEKSIPESLSDGFSLENLSCVPNVTITNCYIGSNRARGYLISTPGNVLIENNIFETSGSAILIAGDANYWYESGAVKDVVIRNNEFRTACNSSPYQFCNAIISIYPEIPEADPNRPYHRDIRIENNSFNPADYPVLYAKSVDGLHFTNNSLARSYDYEPWHPSRYTFVLDACKNVEIAGNSIGDGILGKNILLKAMPTEALVCSDKNLYIVHESMERSE